MDTQKETNDELTGKQHAKVCFGCCFGFLITTALTDNRFTEAVGRSEEITRNDETISKSTGNVKPMFGVYGSGWAFSIDMCTICLFLF